MVKLALKATFPLAQVARKSGIHQAIYFLPEAFHPFSTLWKK